MTKLRDFWRWSERVQERFGVRVVLVVLSLVVVGGSLGQIALRASSINRDRNAILEALTTTSLMAGDDVARSLKEKGTFEAGGREWGDVSLRDASSAIFGPDGRVAIPLEVAEYCLRNEAPSQAPAWLVTQPQTARLGALSISAFVVLVVLLRGFHELLLTGLLTGVAAFLARSLGLLDLGWALAGIGVLGWSFLLLLRAVAANWTLRSRRCSCHRAIGADGRRANRLAAGFIVVMLVVLPLIPLSLDPDAPLRYRVQTFMSWSLGLAFWLAALMTLLLGCSTIATEIRDRQIWQVVTKPISRLRWLVGKWLGLAVLNFVLTATSCVSIFFFIQYLRSQPTAEGLAGREDSFLLQETVLTAQRSISTWDELDNEQLRQRISQIEETDPEIRARGGMGINERRAAVQELRELHNSLQRTVPPAMRELRQII